MRVLLLSLDASIGDPQSASAERMREYGGEVEELWVVVITKHLCGLIEEGRQREYTELAPNVRVVYVSKENKMVRWWQAVRATQKIVRARAIDVVSAQDPFETAFIGYLVTRAHRFRGFHIQIHGDFFGSEFWPRESWVNRLRRALGIILMRRAHALRVVSGRIKASVLKYGVDAARISVAPIYVAPSPVASTYVPSHQREISGTRLLTVSRLSKEKNISSLISIVAELHAAGEDVRLDIVGDGPERTILERLVVARGVGSVITFHGWQRDPSPFYERADIFVFPSLHEGFGRAPIEALAHGLAVVMTDVGCAGEFVVHEYNGLIVPPGNAPALKAALERLVAEPALRVRLGGAGRETVMQLPGAGELRRAILASWRQAMHVS